MGLFDFTQLPQPAPLSARTSSGPHVGPEGWARSALALIKWQLGWLLASGVWIVLMSFLPPGEETSHVTVLLLLLIAGSLLGIVIVFNAWRGTFIHGIVAGVSGTVFGSAAWLKLFVCFGYDYQTCRSFDGDSLLPLMALALIVVLVSGVVALSTGPPVHPLSRGTEALADAVQRVLLRQQAYRFRYWAPEKAINLAFAPLFCLLFGLTCLAVGEIAWRLRLGTGASERAAPILLVRVVSLAVVLGSWVAFFKIVKWMHRRKPIRGESDYASEMALVQSLQNGVPFGLFLRPFSSSGGEKVAAILSASRVPLFYAVQDVRLSSRLPLPEIWIPGKKWSELVFPLMEAATVVVVALPNNLNIAIHSGLLAELRYASAAGLAARFILVTDFDGGRHTKSTSGSDVIAALLESFDNRVSLDALRARIAAITSVA